MIRLMVMAGLALAFGPGSLTAGTADAQSSVRVPQQIQRVPVQRLQTVPEQTEDEEADDEASSLISQRMLELAEEAEQARNRRMRPGHYEVECEHVSEVRVTTWDVQVFCADEDIYGDIHYVLWINMEGLPGVHPEGEEERRRWLASGLIDAIRESQSNPSASLVLSISTLRLGPNSSVRDLSGYRLHYSE